MRNGIELTPDTKETRRALQKLSRKQMELRLLQDIRLDLAVCELEEFPKTEYLEDLAEMINSFKKQTAENDKGMRSLRA